MRLESNCFCSFSLEIYERAICENRNQRMFGEFCWRTVGGLRSLHKYKLKILEINIVHYKCKNHLRRHNEDWLHYLCMKVLIKIGIDQDVIVQSVLRFLLRTAKSYRVQITCFFGGTLRDRPQSKKKIQLNMHGLSGCKFDLWKKILFFGFKEKSD